MAVCRKSRIGASCASGLLAAFFDNPLQLVGLFRRECAGRASENRLALFLTDPFEAMDKIGSHFQPGWRQRLQVLEDVIERTHNS